jgi:DNA-binding PadR family transcriptional regulator
MTKVDKATRRLFRGFIEVHILHHAAQEPVYGLAMIEELARHGYRLSPGTIYPILHNLEGDGLIKSRRNTVRGNVRREYAITSAGRAALREGRAKIRELVEEVMPEESSRPRGA